MEKVAPADIMKRRRVSWKTYLSVGMLSVCIDICGMVMSQPLIPYVVVSLGANVGLAGLVLSAQAAATAISSPITARLSDKIGREVVLMLSMLGSGLGFLSRALAPNLFYLIVFNLISGLSGASIAVLHLMIADVCPKAKRGKWIAQSAAVRGVAQSCFPIFGSLLGAVSLQLPYYIAAAACAFSMIVSAVVFSCEIQLPEELIAEKKSLEKGEHRGKTFQNEETKKDQVAQTSTKHVLYGCLLLQSLSEGAGMVFVCSIIAVVVVKYNLGVFMVGCAIGPYGLIQLLSSYFLPQLLKTKGPMYVARSGFILTCLGMTSFCLMGELLWGFAIPLGIGIVLSAPGALFVTSALPVIVISKTTTTNRAWFVGLLQSSRQFARIFTPPLCTASVATLHSVVPFMASAALMLCSAIYMDYLSKRVLS